MYQPPLLSTVTSFKLIRTDAMQVTLLLAQAL
jgi:hypothetical protein